eukprot:13043194-Ditylum_brightwellii.AAC.1
MIDKGLVVCDDIHLLNQIYEVMFVGLVCLLVWFGLILDLGIEGGSAGSYLALASNNLECILMKSSTMDNKMMM